MSKTKSFLILCAILTFIGIVLAGAGFLLGGRVTGAGVTREGLKVFTLHSQNSQPAAETFTDDNLESFTKMHIDLDYCDIKIEESDHFSLETHLPEERKVVYEVKDGALTLTQERPPSRPYGNSYWFMWGFDPSMSETRNYVRLTVPSHSQFQEIALSSESGDTFLSGLNADSVNIQNDYGDIGLEDLDCGLLALKTESGRISLYDVTAESTDILDDYGDVEFEDVEIAESLNINMDSGNCQLENVTARSVNVKNKYGGMDGDTLNMNSVVMSLESGDCLLNDFLFENVDLRLDYGSAKIRSAEPIDSYGMDLTTEYGDIDIDGQDAGSNHFNLKEGSNRYIRVYCESGDISLISQ